MAICLTAALIDGVCKEAVFVSLLWKLYHPRTSVDIVRSCFSKAGICSKECSGTLDFFEYVA